MRPSKCKNQSDSILMVGKAFEKKIEKRRLMFKNIYIEFIFTLLTLFPHKMSVAIGFDDVIVTYDITVTCVTWMTSKSVTDSGIY